MKLIVGLGNPGKQYENTRHNIGFMILDELAKSWGVSFDKNKFNAEYAMTHYNGEKYILVKPTTYMNLSGEALRKFYDYFEIDIEDNIAGGGYPQPLVYQMLMGLLVDIIDDFNQKEYIDSVSEV